MRITDVNIKNFRTLKDVSIKFSDVTTFVGPNGVGKSTVLKALDWFFNGTPGQITDSDCSFGDTTTSIEVRVTFDQLTKTDRETLGKYVTDGTQTFTAWKTRNPNGDEVFSANARSFPEFNPIRDASKAAEKKSLYKTLCEKRPELGLPGASTQQQIADAMIEWEARNPEYLQETPENLQTNFFGFNSHGVMSGLFDFVLVTADLRASEESTDGKSSIIGRILEKTIDRSVADEQIKAIIDESRLEQERVYKEKFADQLKSVGKQIGDAIGTFSKGRSISVRPSQLEIKLPKTSFELSVVDAGMNTDVSMQGHGFQRTLLIASLQVLANSGEASDEGVICLAVEEPELYQHPVQARVFAKVLRSLASDLNRGIQVTYATHSPYFLESKCFDQVRRLVRQTGEDSGVQVFAASQDDIKNRLRGLVTEKSVDSQLDGMTRNTLAHAIFANRALIVEGTSESAVFYGLGDRNEVGFLEANGLEIVPVGSKTNVVLAHAILDELGIPTYTLFDGDGGAENRSRQQGKDAKKIESEKKNHASLNKKLLRYFNLNEVDFPEQQITDRVAVFEDHLESFLEDYWPEWLELRNSLEHEHGVSLAKNHDGYRIVTMNCQGEPPQFLVEILRKALHDEPQIGSVVY